MLMQNMLTTGLITNLCTLHLLSYEIHGVHRRLPDKHETAKD